MTVLFSPAAPVASSSVYFSKEYGEATVVGRAGGWINLSALDGRCQIPLILTPLESGGFEASSPYGYSGIYASPDVSEGSLAATWANALEVLRLHGVVSVFLRYPPFGDGTEDRFRELSEMALENVSGTISVLTPDSASVWSAMQGRARTAVRKAERLGMSSSVETASPAALEVGGAFRTLYEGTMRRVDAASHHFYSDSYYEMLSDFLGDRLQLVTVRNAEGIVVAAALVLVDDNIVHYHLSGSNPVEARNGANNLLIWALLRWSADNGYASAHLGGGTSAEDSLYKFKASFGGASLQFTVGKVIVNPERYWALVAAKAAALGCSTDDLIATKFFPAFRADWNPDV